MRMRMRTERGRIGRVVGRAMGCGGMGWIWRFLDIGRDEGGREEGVGSGLWVLCGDLMQII
jgi:hypothetical protein